MLKQADGDMDGYGQAFVVSEDQKLDWGDMFYLTTLPPYLRKPHIFPTSQPFRPWQVWVIMGCCGLGPGLGLVWAIIIHKGTVWRRDAINEDELLSHVQPEKVMRLTPHSDAVGLTILLQLNQMEGLQIKKDGLWIPISPLPDAFIINIGDMLEIVTNGAYRSIEHRAVVNSEKERLSIATFYSIKLDGQIGPAPSIISAKNPAKFRSIGTAYYVRGLFARKQ
ncbi:hypothetical protein HAX54_037885 [Datura stramonium]|uniref:Fe2OG dioxygenase domain-containing protein n=1 Tax=Datura stramonium TaxID=4076 RepID=A0ABS8VK99_DATST|nr:hypothetical protein [Datura stramonium]